MFAVYRETLVKQPGSRQEATRLAVPTIAVGLDSPAIVPQRLLDDRPEQEWAESRAPEGPLDPDGSQEQGVSGRTRSWGKPTRKDLWRTEQAPCRHFRVHADSPPWSAEIQLDRPPPCALLYKCVVVELVLDIDRAGGTELPKPAVPTTIRE
ncbi:MAG: hypothetical protein M3O70_06915 [Actinomycetota bacterium]|nr:hypothetical protein [Actinomycetota bacterium]